MIIHLGGGVAAFWAYIAIGCQDNSCILKADVVNLAE